MLGAFLVPNKGKGCSVQLKNSHSVGFCEKELWNLYFLAGISVERENMLCETTNDSCADGSLVDERKNS